jgi:hypothetical protein
LQISKGGGRGGRIKRGSRWERCARVCARARAWPRGAGAAAREARVMGPKKGAQSHQAAAPAQN